MCVLLNNSDLFMHCLLQVLTLSGVARVFNTKRQLLQTLGDFPRAWSLLLEFIENSALSKNNEVMCHDISGA